MFIILNVPRQSDISLLWTNHSLLHYFHHSLLTKWKNVLIGQCWACMCSVWLTLSHLFWRLEAFSPLPVILNFYSVTQSWKSRKPLLSMEKMSETFTLFIQGDLWRVPTEIKNEEVYKHSKFQKWQYKLWYKHVIASVGMNVKIALGSSLWKIITGFVVYNRLPAYEWWQMTSGFNCTNLVHPIPITRRSVEHRTRALTALAK